jgi:hypothetical protein
MAKNRAFWRFYENCLRWPLRFLWRIGYINCMTHLPAHHNVRVGPSSSRFGWTPAQRTVLTARIMLTVSFVCGLEALWRGSVGRTLVAGLILALGGGLLVAAKHAESS